MAEVDRWHGYRVGAETLQVGRLLGRRQVCLYSEGGGVLHVMAYFRNEEEADRCMRLLQRMILVEGEVRRGD